MEEYAMTQSSQLEVSIAGSQLSITQDVRYIVVEDREGRQGVGEKVIEYHCVDPSAHTVVDYQIQLLAPSDGVTMPVVVTEFTYNGAENPIVQKELQTALQAMIQQHVTERYRCTPAITVTSQETAPVVDSTALEVEAKRS